jgi:uncharacterized protein YndB with AHSA1/START domain
MLQKNRFEGDTELIAHPGERTFTVKRTFNAPARLVWEAWTRPEYMRRWYGNHCSKLEECEMDVRIGGKYRRVLRMDDGKAIGFNGEYLELDPPRYIKFTEIFEPFPDFPSTVTVTLDERDGKTHVVVVQEHSTVQARDMHIGSGMEQGMRETLDQLQEFLSALSSQIAAQPN